MRRVATAAARLEDAQRDYRRANVVVMGPPLSLAAQRDVADRKRMAADPVDDCRRAVDTAKADLDRETAAVPRPTWDMVLEPLDP